MSFRDRFRKMNKYQISRQSVQWEANCYMRTGGQTGMIKITVTLRNFTKVLKN